MSKGLKILLGVLSGILVVLIGVFFLVNVVYEPTPETLVYPQGELSDSIFVGQNNVYTENEALAGNYNFETVPYIIDIPSEAPGAKIGSGKVYQVGDGMFVYLTEYDDMTQVSDVSTADRVTQMQDILSSQLPSALLINYVPEETRVTAQVSGDGFINGFSGHYLADSIGITDGAQNVNAVLLGYILDVEEKGFEGKHMYVSVGTTNLTNEAINNASVVLSTVMKTIRMDEERYEEMTEGMDLSEEEEEGAVAEADAEVTDSASTEEIEEPENDVYEKIINSENDDANLQVNIRWENANPDAILELFLPGGQQFCEPLSQDDFSAQFYLTNAPAGDYTLRVKNYEACGDIMDGTSSIGGGSYSSDDYSQDEYYQNDYSTDYSAEPEDVSYETNSY